MSRLHHYKIPNFCVPLPPSYISSIGNISAPPPPPPSHRSLLRPSAKFSPARCSLNPKFPSRSALPPKKSVPVPARDRIIKFGKHKGKMLGALPSAYLQWMYKNSVVWPDLAKEVLDDPVYKDRIEWEYVQRILHGDFGGARIREHQSDDVVADIYEIADKFDWDMEDKRGWSKVELDLLGTSFSGPIPRKNEAKAWWSTKLKAKPSPEEEAMVGMGLRRRERRERRILKSDRELGVGLERREERVTVKTDGELGAAEEESRSDGDGQVVPGKSQEPTVRKGISFPGRESLLKKAKVMNNHKRSS
ncbi:hypothetical protein RHMOL_Rhmol08G0326400 [Rhododendron molle]|uniref:Uncharacterized protein n=1 Tax=Rhododendron molle TaxID=49168 RepID=A0ACC0MWI2_RHOML|nr:hypothetical protein RHMOL_Rhmol08G0326400 [Rhododendron molle]